MAKRHIWIIAASMLSVAWAGSLRAAIPFENQITPGELRGIALHAGDPWNYAFWEYLPSDFETVPDDYRYPLLVFLGGIGEFDDPGHCLGDTDLCTPNDCGTDGLCRNLTWGPQLLIQNGEWNETTRPYIVISPQNLAPTYSTQEWDSDDLDIFVQFVVDNYPVDTRRMYLLGMSQGGRGTIQYAAAYPRRFTAVAPTPGGVVDPDLTCRMMDTGFWAFHGENDNNGNLGAGVFAPCSMVEQLYMYDNPGEFLQYQACADRVGQPSPPGRFTMFDDVGHAAWVPSVDPIGTGFAASEWSGDQGCGIAANFRQYAANLDADGVYSWFASLDRPDVTAPEDLEVDHDAASTPLTAQLLDDDTVTWTWTQLDGPPATLVDADQQTVQVSDLDPEQSYTFEVLVVDADGQWDRDEVVVGVLAEPPPPATSSEGSSGEGGSATTGLDTSTTSPTTRGTSGDGTMSTTTADVTSGSSSDTDRGDAGADGGSTDGCGCSSRSDGPDGQGVWALFIGWIAVRRRRKKRPCLPRPSS